MTFLDQFLAKSDDSFTWKENRVMGKVCLHVTTQKWQDLKWKHDVVLCWPLVQTGSTWLLHITGGDPNELDIQWSQEFADRSGHPVAILFQMPNQPIWDRKEDDLIAHTFEQFLDSGDPDWPLLFPMVKSGIEVMDAVEKYCGSSQNFVAFGASKRGWTSWLLAASRDARIAGIAPMMFDDLKMVAQLEKQWRDWGHLSPMIADYSSRDLHESVGTERGRDLVTMVDPATYLPKIQAPVMIINGASDPYWTVDACNLYWDDIPGQKWLVTIPNIGHSFFPSDYWTPSLIYFLKQIDHPESISPKLIRTCVWSAESQDKHFDQSTWVFDAPLSKLPFKASFQAYEYESFGIRFWANSLVTVDEQKY